MTGVIRGRAGADAAAQVAVSDGGQGSVTLLHGHLGMVCQGKIYITTWYYSLRVSPLTLISLSTFHTFLSLLFQVRELETG